MWSERLPKKLDATYLGRSATTCITNAGSWKTYSPFKLKASFVPFFSTLQRWEIFSTTGQLCLAKKLGRAGENVEIKIRGKQLFLSSEIVNNIL